MLYQATMWSLYLSPPASFHYKAGIDNETPDLLSIIAFPYPLHHLLTMDMRKTYFFNALPSNNVDSLYPTPSSFSYKADTDDEAPDLLSLIAFPYPLGHLLTMNMRKTFFVQCYMK